MKTLGVALIVKNEEKIIERALSSCKDIVDKIIICDTGSTDKTIEIITNFAESNKIFSLLLSHMQVPLYALNEIDPAVYHHGSILDTLTECPVRAPFLVF